MQKIRSLAQHIRLWTALACALLSLIPSNTIHAQSSSNCLGSPTCLSATSTSTAQGNVGTTFVVNIRSYSDNDPNGTRTVKGSVTYPTNRFQVVGLSTSGSQYGNPIKDGNIYDGTISFDGARAANGGFDNPAMFTVTLKALEAGSATVSFSGDSNVNSVLPTRIASTSFTITNPSPPPATSTAPRPSSTPKPSNTPVPIVSTTPTPTPEATPEPLPTPDPTGVVDSVNVSPSFTSADIIWKVNAKTPTSTLRYGSQSSTLDSTATVTTREDGSFAATVSKLEPGKRYYFAIEGTGSDGKKGTYSGVILANGYPVTISVTENNTPAKNAQVKIGSTSRTTNSNGKLSIGLAAGSYTGTITSETASLSIKFTVEAKPLPEDGSAPATQAFPFGLTSASLNQDTGSGASILTFVGVLIGGTVIFGLGFAGFIAWRRRSFEMGGGGSNSYASDAPSVIIDDGYTWKQDTLPEAQERVSPPPQMENIPTTPTHHNNSVYIDEDEPVDMFEKPTAFPSQESSQQNADGMQQNPNQPHSTKL